MCTAPGPSCCPECQAVAPSVCVGGMRRCSWFETARCGWSEADSARTVVRAHCTLPSPSPPGHGPSVSLCPCCPCRPCCVAAGLCCCHGARWPYGAAARCRSMAAHRYTAGHTALPRRRPDPPSDRRPPPPPRTAGRKRRSSRASEPADPLGQRCHVRPYLHSPLNAAMSPRVCGNLFDSQCFPRGSSTTATEPIPLANTILVIILFSSGLLTKSINPPLQPVGPLNSLLWLCSGFALALLWHTAPPRHPVRAFQHTPSKGTARPDRRALHRSRSSRTCWRCLPHRLGPRALLLGCAPLWRRPLPPAPSSSRYSFSSGGLQVVDDRPLEWVGHLWVGGAVRPPELKLKIPAQLFCMSWCPDLSSA